MKNVMDYTVEEIQNITDDTELLDLSRNLASRCYFYRENFFGKVENRAKCRELTNAVNDKLDEYWERVMAPKGVMRPSK